MSLLFSTILAAALVNNLCFVQLLALSPMFAGSRRLDSATELAVLGGGMLFGSCCLNLWLYRWLLQPLSLQRLDLLLFMTVSGLIGVAVLHWLRHRFPLIARRQGLAIPLLSCSGAVIGSSLIIPTAQLSMLQLIASCLGTAAGFSGALVGFAALRDRTDHIDTPEAMRGPPLDLISAGIVAMCLVGFAGDP